MKGKAFTLAETLITLAIIGIVAVLTIVPLNHKYKKSQTETSLKKFYRNMNMAIRLSSMENGDPAEWEFPNVTSKESALEFFEKYLAKYINILKIETETNEGGYFIYVYLADGSGFIIKYRGHDYIYCINGSDISKFTSDQDYKNNVLEGTKCFTFGLYPTSVHPSKFCTENFYGKGLEPFVNSNDTEFLNDKEYVTYKDLYEVTKIDRAIGAKIIQLNGWKIPDDYPFKI